MDKDLLKKLMEDKLKNGGEVDKSLPFRKPPKDLLDNAENQNNSESESNNSEEKDK
jgi:hypothetical protein